MHRSFVVAVAALCGMGLAPAAASASVTYFYGCKINPTNSRDGGMVGRVDLHGPITFAFTVATPLTAHLAGSDIAPSALSWTASAGKPTSTVTSTDVYPFLRFFASTDGTGTLTAGNIVASATSPVLPNPPGYDEQFLFDQNISGSDTAVHFTELAFGQPIGGALCSSGCGAGDMKRT